MLILINLEKNERPCICIGSERVKCKDKSDVFHCCELRGVNEMKCCEPFRGHLFYTARLLHLQHGSPGFQPLFTKHGLWWRRGSQSSPSFVCVSWNVLSVVWQIATEMSNQAFWNIFIIIQFNEPFQEIRLKTSYRGINEQTFWLADWLQFAPR